MIVRPTLFPVGSETLSWIRQSGRMADVPLQVSLLVRWQSFWFDRNLSLQRKLVPGTWQGNDPLFILGLWRSGTTFMHELLGAFPGLVWPATWQCMNPSTFKMQSPPRVSKSVVRPMDDFTVDTFSPQEDEFALLALGVPSVYRGFFDPGRLSELSQWLDPDIWCGRSDGWIERWRGFLGGISAGKGGRLLLKSPNHTFRIRALVEEFPKASYVWLVREPAETLFSNRKMWVAMFRRYALWHWNESELDEFLGKAFQYSAESLAFATTVLGRDQLVVVDFNRLKQSPVETIEAVCHRLNLGEWDPIKNAVITSVAGRTNNSGDSYPGCQMSQEQIKAAENLGITQKAALGSHGL
jgi:omega-hydroxy-beta-dihydromenaquinone-9 sulfotransferase